MLEENLMARLKKRNQQRERAPILISSLLRKKNKKKKQNFSTHYATDWGLLVQLNACPGWAFYRELLKITNKRKNTIKKLKYYIFKG